MTETTRGRSLNCATDPMARNNCAGGSHVGLAFCVSCNKIGLARALIWRSSKCSVCKLGSCSLLCSSTALSHEMSRPYLRHPSPMTINKRKGQGDTSNRSPFRDGIFHTHNDATQVPCGMFCRLVLPKHSSLIVSRRFRKLTMKHGSILLQQHC